MDETSTDRAEEPQDFVDRVLRDAGEVEFE